MSGLQYKKNEITYGTSFKNEDTMESLAMKLDGNLISITLGELKKDKENKLETIKDSTMEVKFGSMNLHILLDIFEECYELYMAEKKFESEGIVSGTYGNQITQISDGSNIDRPYGLYLVVYKDANIDEDFRNCKKRIYQFSTKKTIVGFNMGKGHKVKERKIEAKVFRGQLKNYAEEAFGGVQHAVKKATRFDTDKLMKGVMALCAHNNISFIGERSAGGQNKGMHQMLISQPETYSLDIPEIPSELDLSAFDE